MISEKQGTHVENFNQYAFSERFDRLVGHAYVYCKEINFVMTSHLLIHEISKA